MAQEIFRRVEKKYLLTRKKCEELLKDLEAHIERDKYYDYTIRNIYFDSRTDELIRTSIEKPVYKEKFRVRCYNTPKEESDVFLEIKKKYQGIVHKRRVVLPYREARQFVDKQKVETSNPQIEKEIRYVIDYYGLQPKLYLAYDRYAYQGTEDKEFRITFDYNIRSRRDNLSLSDDTNVTSLLEDDYILMEVKVPEALPLWFVHILEKHQINSISFSKYGMIYKRELSNKGA